jgi:hypothetical protein
MLDRLGWWGIKQCWMGSNKNTKRAIWNGNHNMCNRVRARVVTNFGAIAPSETASKRTLRLMQPAGDTWTRMTRPIKGDWKGKVHPRFVGLPKKDGYEAHPYRNAWRIGLMVARYNYSDKNKHSGSMGLSTDMFAKDSWRNNNSTSTR